MSAVDLNDAAAIRRVDSQDMLELTVGYGDQFRQGLTLAEEQFVAPSTKPEFERVVLLGTGGGSAASGNLLRSYLFDTLKVPFVVSQGYHAPAFVDAKTLVLVVSHSGNTEETLSAYQEAAARGAHVVAITAGGKLLEDVQRRRGAVILVPGGLMPRAALGYIFVPILVVMHRLGLVADPRPAVEATAALFDRLAVAYGPESPVAQNPAKQLAERLSGKIPLVYGSLPYLEGVAWRWKNQFGENSKLMAFWNVVPALHHDEIVGWDGPPELTTPFGVVFLREAGDEPKIVKRIDITRDILSERAGTVSEVYSQGGSLMERLFSLVLLGDFVSLYVPIARGVDPTPVAVIDLFKRRMAE